MDLDATHPALRMELDRSIQERDLARRDNARLMGMLEEERAEARAYREAAEASQRDLLARVARLTEQVALSNNSTNARRRRSPGTSR